MNNDQTTRTNHGGGSGDMAGDRNRIADMGGKHYSPADERLSSAVIMKRVRERLQRRHDGLVLHRDATEDSGLPPRWTPAAGPLATKQQYALEELLAHSDQDFVETAYRAVLRREPDPDGLAHHLGKLRSGAMSKVELLAVLRWSPEGEARSVHVDGLLAPYLLHKWKRKRFIGPVISWMHAFVRLGPLVERQRIADVSHAMESQRVGRHLNRAGHYFDRRLGDLQQQLEELATRTDREHGAAIERQHATLDARLAAIEGSHAELLEHRFVTESRLDAIEPRLLTIEGLEAIFQEHRLVTEARLDAIEPHLHAFASLETRLGEAEVILARLRARAEEAEQRAIRVTEAAQALDPLYAAFEDRFRGDRALVRTRVEPYLEWMREAGAGSPDAPVLDIGSGRGEWLELLRDHGLHGRGIDLNRVFIDACRGRGLDVVEGDAIASLRAMPESSIGAVTSMHLVEHLPFESMVELIDQIRRVLRPGGMILLETPNPENLLVGSCNFYMDPTHRNPLPPEALRWIVEARGFMGARVERLTHARDLGVPPPLADDIPGADAINVLLRSINTAPDYAIVARHP